MKFCPTCGKQVHRTDKKFLVLLVNQAERVKHSYNCEDERHEWIEFLDPYGGASIIQEAM
jgi:hypothetical protein